MRRRHLAGCVLAATALLACGCKKVMPPTPEQLEAQRLLEAAKAGRAVLLERLVDPESARFRQVTIGADVHSPDRTRSGQRVLVICGQVNSRNRMGGYGGSTPFALVQRKAEDFSDAELTMPDPSSDNPEAHAVLVDLPCQDRGPVEPIDFSGPDVRLSGPTTAQAEE